jgi:hypothetical protein
VGNSDNDGNREDPEQPLGPIEFIDDGDGDEEFHFCYTGPAMRVSKDFIDTDGGPMSFRVLLERFKEFMLDCGYSQEAVNRIVILDS